MQAFDGSIHLAQGRQRWLQRQAPVLESIPDAVAILDRQGRRLYGNDLYHTLCREHGVPDLRPATLDATMPGWEEIGTTASATGHWEGAITVPAAHTPRRTLRCHVRPMIAPAGGDTLFAATIADITELAEAHQTSDGHARLIAQLPHLQVPGAGAGDTAVRAFRDTLVEALAAIDLGRAETIPDGDETEGGWFYCPLTGDRQEARLVWRVGEPRHGGRAFQARFHAARELSPAERRLAVTATRALTTSTERAGQLARLRRTAFSDDVTDLLNRRGFEHFAAPLLAGGQPASLLLIDMDRFNRVIGTLGHDAADAYLHAMGERLVGAAGPGRLVARMGGDEFAILVPGGMGLARGVAEAIHERLETPMTIAARPVRARVHIGIASAPRHGSSLAELRRCADRAMFTAKRTGRSTNLFRPERELTDRTALWVEGRLEAAISEELLTLAVQPIMRLDSGEVTEVELLLRWDDPMLGTVAPATFVPVAEHAGLSERLDRYVVAKGLRETRHLDCAVAINLAAPTLYDPAFADFVFTHLEHAGRTPDTMVFEITERLVADADRARPTLQRLTDAGVRIAIDDFGAGYSSLGVLPDLPLSRLKVDKSFLIGSRGNPRHREVIIGTLRLASALGLEALVEGVERAEDMEWLRGVGCDFAQGFLFGTPIALSDWPGTDDDPRPA